MVHDFRHGSFSFSFDSSERRRRRGCRRCFFGLGAAAWGAAMAIAAGFLGKAGGRVAAGAAEAETGSAKVGASVDLDKSKVPLK